MLSMSKVGDWESSTTLVLNFVPGLPTRPPSQKASELPFSWLSASRNPVALNISTVTGLPKRLLDGGARAQKPDAGRACEPFTCAKDCSLPRQHVSSKFDGITLAGHLGATEHFKMFSCVEASAVLTSPGCPQNASSGVWPTTTSQLSAKVAESAPLCLHSNSKELPVACVTGAQVVSTVQVSGSHSGEVQRWSAKYPEPASAIVTTLAQLPAAVGHRKPLPSSQTHLPNGSTKGSCGLL
mmetsp:Transcript_24838/g.71244  ORF Transcript_24838/g.71244 Transcript_24838/m.71244 type:complete len:240 (-) Transcript_24838:370-1089(-)